jgi:Fe-S oxidoreductase
MAFRDDYTDLVNDERAKRVASQMFLIDEFLVREQEAGRLNLNLSEIKKTIKVHGHCQQKALVGLNDTVKALSLVPGYQVEALNTGCCGMAGSFGYENNHYDISMKIAEDRLFPALRAAGEDVGVAAPGTSCRHQIADGLGRQARHPIEWIHDALVKT